MSLVLFMVAVSTVTGLLGPYLIGYTIDHYIGHRSSAELLDFIVLLAGVYFLQSASTFLGNYLMIGILQDTVFKMRTQLFEQFHRLLISFFDRRQHGELMSRVTNDIDNGSQTLNNSAIQIFSSTLTISGMAAIMLWLRRF
ncbi:ABC transporter transmembrane domain-containing protein [Weizmannia acidilactici]|nr:ABC transporter transmembrane domain-containing protein [Weizmannia acidilactici]